MDSTFTLLPLSMDPSSKAISCPSISSDDALTTALTQLNTLHRTLLNLPATPGQTGSNTTPPPPMPPNPKRSAQINKMREQANAALKKASGNPSQAQEAIKLYTFAITIALTRPPFEASALLRDESSLYANRAQAYMVASQWPEGAADAACSVELKRQGNGKAWWRRGRCLVEMGRWEDAARWVAEGRGELENENAEGAKELKELEFEIKRHMQREER